MTTAKITNIIAEGVSIVVFVEFSTGEGRNYRFDSNITKDMIKDRIKRDILEFDAPAEKVKALASLISEIIK